MAALIHPLLTLLASLTRQELAKQLTYLQTENRTLRSKLPQRIELSNHERSQLVKHGKSLGPRIRNLMSVVSYSTVRRWVRSMEATPETGSRKKVARAGRPWVEEGVHDPFIQIRKEDRMGLHQNRSGDATVGAHDFTPDGEKRVIAGRPGPRTARSSGVPGISSQSLDRRPWQVD
jgi:putative transposase